MEEVEWDKLFKKSQEGMYFESIGEIEKSIEIYEYCVEKGWDGSHVYDKLSIYYKKNKRYKDSDRVIRKYLEIYKIWFDNNNFHDTWKMENENKYLIFKKRLDSIQQYL
jgi:hypothetical protein